MTLSNAERQTRDSQTKRLNTACWTSGNLYMSVVMRALQEKRGNSYALNAAGKAYDKFAWYHATQSGDLLVPLAHYRSVKPMVATQLRRMGYPRDYIEAYLHFEGATILGEDLRQVVEQRFWNSLSAATNAGVGA